MKWLVPIVTLLVGLAVGVGVTSVALQGTPIPVRVVPAAPGVEATAVALATANHVAADTDAENPYRIHADHASTLADLLPTNTAPENLRPALRAYGQALRDYAEEASAAADATSGMRGTAGSTWHSVKSVFGDERRTLPNDAARVAAEKALDAAAAKLVAAFGEVELDESLPGVEAEG
ncbi:MAG: hypothetical protein AAF743_10165 [Planctomycetota bacterium]